MSKEEQKRMLARETIATVYMGNIWNGLEIKEIQYGIEDYVIFVDTFNNRVHKAKINYKTETPHFRYQGNIVYLDKCIRCA